MKFLATIHGIFVVLALLFCQQVCSGQEYNFERISNEDGLSQSSVTCLVQDKFDFIWVGTDDGLNKYDGYSFQVYKSSTSDENGLSSNAIQSIIEDQAGNLWVGTSKGLCLFNRELDIFVKDGKTPSAAVSAMQEDDKGGLWISVIGAALYYYQPKTGQLHNYNTQNSKLCSIDITCLFYDSKGRLWVGTRHGLSSFVDGESGFRNSFSSKSDISTLSSDYINAIAEDAVGNIWIGTENGVNKLIDHGGRYSFTHLDGFTATNSSIKPGLIHSLLIDSNNRLWVSIENEGINIRDINGETDAWTHFQNIPFIETSISSNSVKTMYQDQQGNIWLGTFVQGLNLLQKDFKAIRHYVHNPYNLSSISNNNVNVFLEEKGEIWVGTEGGLNRISKKNHTVKRYTFNHQDEKSISSNAIWSVFRDRTGHLWVGTWGGGLNLLNEKSDNFTRLLTTTADNSGIKSNNIFSIYEDKDSELWLGTMGEGLCLFDRENTKFKNYHLGNSNINGDYIEQILQMDNGDIVINNAYMVLKFDPKTELFEKLDYKYQKGLSLNNSKTFCLYEDSKHNLWIGNELGLFVKTPKNDTAFCYQQKHGLPNNSVKSICEDLEGNLWLGTNYGISKGIEAVARPLEVTFENLNSKDGLLNNEFNRRSCLCSTDSLIYFGGTKGIDYFNPHQLHKNPHLSRVVLTDFLLFNKSVEIGAKDSLLKKHISVTKKITLAHMQSVISFRYVAINYISTQKNTYTYQLEGFDEDWVYADTRRQVTYTNLEPGQYILKIKAANSDNIWNPEVASIEIEVLPPFWKSTWAYLLYIALVVVGLFLFRRYSLHELKRKNRFEILELERQKEKEITQSKLRFFTNVSHEIRTPLTLIKGPLQSLQLSDRTDSHIKKELELVNINVARLLNLTNQLLDFRRIDTGHLQLSAMSYDIVHLSKEVTQAFEQYCIEKGVKLVLETDVSELPIWIDVPKITTVLYNLLSNAIKFSYENSPITIKIDEIDDISNYSFTRDTKLAHDQVRFARLSVSNYGVGIPINEIDKVFDRFYQGDPKRYVGSKGSGIGLNITREYIRLHAGEVFVHSMDKGVDFEFLLPLGKQHLRQDQISENSLSGVYAPELFIDIKSGRNVVMSEPTVLDSDKVHKHKILVVEDNDDLRQYIVDNLKSEYIVYESGDGKEAHDKIYQIFPALIISDVMMPEIDGIELCRMVKFDLATNHIPVILLTAKAADEDIILGVDQGADAYLIKPFNMNLLKSYVSTLIDNRDRLIGKYQRHSLPDPGKSDINPLDQLFFASAMKSVEDNLSNDQYGVQELSDDLNMSHRSLVRKIKAVTGQTANEFIRTMRLKKSIQILENQPDISVMKLSYMMGFSDPGYFTRCFQKEFGVSPKKYLDRHQVNE